jgi:hypothetical protein
VSCAGFPVAINTERVTRLRSRGDSSGRTHTSPNSTSSVSVARPGAILGCTLPDGFEGGGCALAIGASYWASVTFSNHSTVVPSRCSVSAMCVIDVRGAAPCQCFWPAGIRTTSPVRISSMGPPQAWTLPVPAVTINVWPRGCVCQAVRAPASNATEPPLACDGSTGWNSLSTRTLPVKFAAGPGCTSREPARVTLIADAVAPAGASAARLARRSVPIAPFEPMAGLRW